MILVKRHAYKMRIADAISSENARGFLVRRACCMTHHSSFQWEETVVLNSHNPPKTGKVESIEGSRYHDADIGPVL